MGHFLPVCFFSLLAFQLTTGRQTCLTSAPPVCADVYVLGGVTLAKATSSFTNHKLAKYQLVTLSHTNDKQVTSLLRKVIASDEYLKVNKVTPSKINADFSFVLFEKTNATFRLRTLSVPEHSRFFTLKDNRISDIERFAFSNPNTFITLILSFNSLRTLKQNNFWGLTHLVYLHLENNEIASIEGGSFSGLNRLESLKLNDNNLTVIKRNQFEGLEKLRTINLDDNMIMHIERKSFEQLRSLKTLSLRNNRLTCLKSLTFFGLLNLERLSISNNLIDTIEAEALLSLVSLQHVDLGSNNLTTIDNRLFYDVINLTSVNFDDNSLTGIPNVFFLPHLQYLSLAQNNIDDVTNQLGQLKSLTTITLKNNNLKEIKGSFFKDMSKLEYIQMQNNNIIKIEKGAFHNLPKVVTLNLNKNNIEHLTGSLLKGLTGLHVIWLENNKLSVIGRKTFEETPNIQSILLGGNNITDIKKQAFHGAKHVSFQLGLEGNRLTVIENHYFEGLQKLQILNLSNNLISVIEETAFEGLASLIILDLSRNELKYLSAEFFPPLTGMKQLDLSGNRMTSTDVQTFSKLYHMFDNSFNGCKKGIRNIGLRDNPWDCGDANLIRVYNWTKTNNISVEVICWSPEGYRNESWEDVLDGGSDVSTPASDEVTAETPEDVSGITERPEMTTERLLVVTSQQPKIAERARSLGPVQYARSGTDPHKTLNMFNVWLFICFWLVVIYLSLL